MNLVRITFVALALLVPASWTVAKAGDEPPAGDKSDKSGETKTTKKKSKKTTKKTEGSSGDTKGGDEPPK